MNYERMAEHVNGVLDYLEKRKEAIFDQIQTVQRELETVDGTINEQEKYMEIEEQREEQERNIFSLYETSDQYKDAKAQLSSQLHAQMEKKARLEQMFEQLKKEFAEVREAVICNEVIVEYFIEETKKEEPEPIQETPKNYELDIENRLQFCISILELDKERCMQELQQIIQDLRKNAVDGCQM